MKHNNFKKVVTELGSAGNIAVTVALATVPMVLLAGAAVDLGRVYYVRSELSKALDAATLSVASSSLTDTSTLNYRLQDLFTANYHLSNIATPTTPTMTISGNIVDSSVSTTVQMTLLAPLIPSMTVSVTSEVSKQTSGIELVMVLDTTGSMSSNNKMPQLKVAAHNLITQLFGSSSSSSSVSVGIVPFTDTVNIGRSNTSYVDQSGFVGLDWGTTSWGGCVMAPNSSHDQDDAFYSTKGAWLPYYWPSDQNNYWKRVTTSHGKTTTTYTINSTQGPNYQCNAYPIVPLTNQRAPLDAAIDALQPAGSTHINVGLAWGWYTISPNYPFTEGQPYDSTKIKKYIVLMTDGQNTIQTFSAYGNLSQGKLGTTNATAAVTELYRRQKIVCDNIKALGVTIFTVALEVTDATSNAALSDCATPPGRYFSATSSNITDVFNTIGGQISKVRLTK